MSETNRVNCYMCECFEPMKKQKKIDITLGTCHLDPPSVMPDGSSKWPMVVKEYGYCFSGVKKDG